MTSADKLVLLLCTLPSFFNELGEAVLPSLELKGLATEWWLQLRCSVDFGALCLLLDLSCCRSLLSSAREKGESEEEKAPVNAGLDFHMPPAVLDEK